MIADWKAGSSQSAIIHSQSSMPPGVVMTRETKIGLLVGLAFIIVIGILLSDHINAAGDPLRADITKIDGVVKEGVNTPHSQPQSTDTVVQVRPVVPQNPIRTEPE